MSGGLRRSYGGAVLLEKGGRYELHEEGVLLAATDSPAVADKLFYKLALERAAAVAAQREKKGVLWLTAAGRERFLSGDQAEEQQEQQETSHREKKEVQRFQPPTVEEVAAYCRERGNTVDAADFVDHYTANGWMAGRVKMKDWKAAVRTWERKEHQTSGQARTSRWVAQTQPEKSSLDMAEMEEAILRHTPVFHTKAR